MDRASILAAFDALPPHDRLRALRAACADALEVWQRAREGSEPIVYVDGVVGMRHVVDDGLPARALDEVDRKLRGESVDPGATVYAYLEPLSALQDDDLSLPNELAYYAIYNLHRLVFERPALTKEHTVLSQVASAVGVEPDAWFVSWWARRGVYPSMR